MEFTLGSVHKAVATFSNPKSAGFDYTATLCMGAGWTEMASASFHLDAGQSKAVEFSVTMPTTPGTYPVYFKVTSGGVLIGAFASEAISIVGVDIGPIILLSINDQPLVRNPDGSISLVNTPTVSGLWQISIKWQNKTLEFSQDIYNDLMFYLNPSPAFTAKSPYDSPPAYRGWSSLQLKCTYPGGCPPGTRHLEGSFVATCPLSDCFGGGAYTKGLYHGSFRWGQKYYDQILAATMGSFTITNMALCTGERIYE